MSLSHTHSSNEFLRTQELGTSPVVEGIPEVLDNADGREISINVASKLAMADLELLPVFAQFISTLHTLRPISTLRGYTLQTSDEPLLFHPPHGQVLESCSPSSRLALPGSE
jgi:hypothetical protein